MIAVSSANPNPDDESESPRIISPFAQTTSTVQSTRGGKSGSRPLWGVSSLLLVLILAVVAYFILQYLDNPYRTLTPFPMDTFMSDYRSMTGVKFKADLKVANDLGQKDATGRLMIFNIVNDSRPLPVLIPPKLGGIFFVKGQVYQASLEVGEGGLVYADTCDKE